MQRHKRIFSNHEMWFGAKAAKHIKSTYLVLPNHFDPWNKVNTLFLLYSERCKI